MFQKILNVEFSIPDDVPEAAKDLILHLIKKNPLSRLGSNDQSPGLSMKDLKSHPFFENVDFEKIHKVQSPLLDIITNLKRKLSMADAWDDSDEEDLLHGMEY